MGVDPTGGVEHGRFSRRPSTAQTEKCLVGGKKGSLLSDDSRLLKVGQQGSSAVKEGK